MDVSQIYAQMGRNILFLRKHYGVSRKTLAKLLGIPYARLRRVESGEPVVRMYDFHLKRLADIFNVSADALVYEEIENN